MEFKNVFIQSYYTGLGTEEWLSDVVITEREIKFSLNACVIRRTSGYCKGLEDKNPQDIFTIPNPFKDLRRVKLVSEPAPMASPNLSKNINFLTDGKLALSFWKNKDDRIRGRVVKPEDLPPAEEIKEKLENAVEEYRSKIYSSAKKP